MITRRTAETGLKRPAEIRHMPIAGIPGSPFNGDALQPYPPGGLIQPGISGELRNGLAERLAKDLVQTPRRHAHFFGEILQPRRIRQP